MGVLSIDMIAITIFVVLRLFVLSNDHLWCGDLCIETDLSPVNMYNTVPLSIQMMGKPVLWGCSQVLKEVPKK